jgi:hypothetical protein
MDLYNVKNLNKIELLPGQLPMYCPEFTLRQVIKLKFKQDQGHVFATIRGIHLYEDRIKYDLAIWLGDGSVDDPERETRIYNVESEFLEVV